MGKIALSPQTFLADIAMKLNHKTSKKGVFFLNFATRQKKFSSAPGDQGFYICLVNISKAIIFLTSFIKGRLEEGIPELDCGEAVIDLKLKFNSARRRKIFSSFILFINGKLK